MLNYPSLREDEEGFNEVFKTSQNRHIIGDILYWLLTKREELKTRAYIAKFLQSFDLPQEFLVDPIVYDLLEQLNQQKVVFKQTHQEYTQLLTSDGVDVNIQQHSGSSYSTLDMLRQLYLCPLSMR